MLALVTCKQARGYDTDLALLQRELPDALLVEWDDPAVDWSAFDTVVLRSPWDYHLRRHEFLAWAHRVSEVAALWNPVEVIEWNTDKRYLAELSARGITTVPTRFVGGKAEVWECVAAGGFDGDVIVKPSVGASARGVRRHRDNPARAAAHARMLVNDGLTAMVQPYLATVATRGETNLVYLGGEFSHAVNRHVEFPPPADRPFGEETSNPVEPTHEQRALADAAMAVVPSTAYARIDLVDGSHGPVLLEVELTEPSLFLHLAPHAPARAAAVFRNL